MRVVIDTNLFVSGIFWRGSPALVYDAAVTGKFTILVTETPIEELHRVLGYEKFESRLLVLGRTADQITEIVRSLAEHVEPADVPPNAIRDAKDRAVLACAAGGKADFIISGDKDLLTLGAYGGISILDSAHFLERLSTEQ
jgi:uncharacterized protein